MIFMLEQALAHPQGEPLATERSVDHWQALAATPGEGAAFLPPTRGTVYGTLLNHLDALAALGDQVHAAPYKAPPRAPILYIKPRNTVVGHRVPVVVPADAAELEMGATLGVVIGRTASRVAESEALACVAGYTVVNDISVPHASVYRPSMRFKCRDGFCPMGPAIVARKGVADPDALVISVTHSYGAAPAQGNWVQPHLTFFADGVADEQVGTDHQRRLGQWPEGRVRQIGRAHV